MEQRLRKSLLREDRLPHPTIEAIRRVCAQMELVENRFSQETDRDLIEGCIYEMQSLRAQYRYLLRTARDEGITCEERSHLWNE